MIPSLRFEERTHEYFLDYKGLHSEPLPHVTEILRVMGLYVVPFNAREFHRERGKAIHDGCVYINSGVWDPDTTDVGVQPEHRIRGYLESFCIFAEETGFSGEMAEVAVYSALYRYAGKFDFYGMAARYGFERWLVDVKAGDIVPAYHLQTALYEQALKENLGRDVDKRIVVQLFGDGSRPRIREGSMEDRARALEAVNLYHWRRRHKLILNGKNDKHDDEGSF